VLPLAILDVLANLADDLVPGGLQLVPVVRDAPLFLSRMLAQHGVLLLDRGAGAVDVLLEIGLRLLPSRGHAVLRFLRANRELAQIIRCRHFNSFAFEEGDSRRHG
jgi:hypothetical protein